MSHISDSLFENLVKSVLCRTHKTHGETLISIPSFWRDGILTVASNVVFAGIACGYALGPMPRNLKFEVGWLFERSWTLFFDESKDANGYTLQDVLIDLSQRIFTADPVMFQQALQIMRMHYEKVGFAPAGVEQIPPMMLFRSFGLAYIATADASAS
jgi:hypothetical protein